MEVWDTSVWQLTDASAPLARGQYVAISGNTGAGKSTLVRALVDALRARDLPVIGINERAFHHPLLPGMFADPARYAFGVQLNFMLQRHMALRHWLEHGHTVVMERSHLDDQMFVEQHAAQGTINAAQFDAYLQLAHVLHADVPFPTVFVCLDVPPALSFAATTPRPPGTTSVSPA